jgi:hypothetical protein
MENITEGPEEGGVSPKNESRGFSTFHGVVVPSRQDGHENPPYSNEHWILFAGIFVFASVGGLAALLREGADITWRETFSALLNSGMMGCIVAMILWNRFQGDDLFLLIGISALSGFGGSTIVDFAIKALKKRAAKFFE